MRALRTAALAIILSGVSFAQTISLPGQSTPVSLTWLYYNKMRWAGAWSGSTTYNPQDVVSSGGYTYVSLSASNLNHTPATSPTWWSQLPTAADTLGSLSGQQLQFARIKPNAGNATTYELAAPAFTLASDYNFPAQTCAGSNICSAGGSNGAVLVNGVQAVLTMTPCPLGMGGATAPIRISGGVGTAESVSAVFSSPGTPQSMCTATFTPVNGHSGAFTLQSASGGLDQAICSLPAAGGIVDVNASLTLNGNVGSCGKTAVVVRRYAGATITGAFTILGATQDNVGTHQFVSTQYSASVAQNSKAFSFQVGDVPEAFNTQTGLFGGFHAPTSSSSGQWAAIHGVLVVDGPNTVPGVALLSDAYANGDNLFGLWAAAFAVNNCHFVGAGCGAGLGHQVVGTNATLYTLELDGTAWKVGAAAYNGGITILQITGLTEAQTVGSSIAINIDQLGITNHIPFQFGIYTKDGAVSGNVFDIGTVGIGNNVTSQIINFRTRDSGGVNRSALIFGDPNGNLILRPGSGGQVIGQDSAGNIGWQIVPNASAPWVSFPNQIRASMLIGVGNYIASESGANNAIVGTFSLAPAVSDGFCVVVKLAHTLQVGANTFNYNGGGAVAIKSHLNPANNIASAYAVGARWVGCYDAANAVWQDSAQ